MISTNCKHIVFFLLFASFFLTMIQSFGKNNAKVQGKWSVSGDSGDSTDMRAWFLTYEFEGRNYKMSGYPPISEEGSFEIVQEKGDSLQVYFNVIKSSPDAKSHKDWIVAKDSALMIGQVTLRKTN